MLIRVRMDLAFDIDNQNQAQALRDAVVPFAQHAINPNEEEIGYIEAEKCYHGQEPAGPCEVIARWEVGRGRVI